MLMYLPLAWLNMYQDLKSIDQYFLNEALSKIQKSVISTQQKLFNDGLMQGCIQLDANHIANNITGYWATQNGNACQQNDQRIQRYKDQITPNEYSSFQFDNGQIYTYYRVLNDKADFIVEGRTNTEMTIWQRIRYVPGFRKALIKDLILVVYIIFAFIFLGVLILAESIRNQFRKSGEDPRWLKIINKVFGFMQLHDLKVLKFANQALMKQNDDLERDKELLETSLEFSILNEIKLQNQKVPYAFQGTVVKVDINGFSKVIAAGHKNATLSLTRALEEYGCELLQRYGGLFEKTVGDEIVVVFKNENSQLNAVAFARDLMEEFSKIEFDFGTEKRKFTLKSSLNSSLITFSKRPSGYGFSGDALTFTTRLLDVVKLKDRNVLSLLKESAADVRELIYFPPVADRFEFKNMNPADGYQIDQFMSFEKAYAEHANLLKFYKSDTAILHIFNKILSESDFEKVKDLLACLSQIQVRRVSPELIQGWKNFIQTLVQSYNAEKISSVPQADFILAQGITLASQLIPNESWDQSCIDLMLSVPRNIQGRVNASVVELLSNKNLVHVVIDQARTFIIPNDQSFRTRGNLLLSQGLFQLSDQVFFGILRMLQSPNELEMATGVYTATQLIKHYKATNPAALETFDQYKKVTQRLQLLRKNKSEQISKRLHEMIDQAVF